MKPNAGSVFEQGNPSSPGVQAGVSEPAASHEQEQHLLWELARPVQHVVPLQQMEATCIGGQLSTVRCGSHMGCMGRCAEGHAG